MVVEAQGLHNQIAVFVLDNPSSSIGGHTSLHMFGLDRLQLDQSYEILTHIIAKSN